MLSRGGGRKDTGEARRVRRLLLIVLLGVVAAAGAAAAAARVFMASEFGAVPARRWRRFAGAVAVRICGFATFPLGRRTCCCRWW